MRPLARERRRPARYSDSNDDDDDDEEPEELTNVEALPNGDGH